MAGENLRFGDMEVASEQWTEREKELAELETGVYKLVYGFPK